jgi:hypothetical protein
MQCQLFYWVFQRSSEKANQSFELENLDARRLSENRKPTAEMRILAHFSD